MCTKTCATTPDWEETTRFYLPNEDAEVAREALRLLAKQGLRLRSPLLVTGSGMLALDLLPDLPQCTRMECLDLSPFQDAYFARVKAAMEKAASPQALVAWVLEEIVPEINAFYAARGKSYTEEGVKKALAGFFRLKAFADSKHLAAVQKRLHLAHSARGNMVERVGRSGQESSFDFVHLSNIVDYLPEASLRALFSACMQAKAPVFFIETTACQDRPLLEACWREAGYSLHPENDRLCAMNRALGTLSSQKAWMRPGRVCLLLPRASA